ncbi:MAG: DNA ligase D [Bauldia sp.]|nr:DNA ligase D [Bauldia sp.]
MADDLLKTYRAKRDFRKTAEPGGGRQKRKAGGNRYLIQKHDATRLHYDLRLEKDGVFKSWAVTRGPSLDPADKRLAVRTEDHPLDYGDFEGTIPKGEYGGGTVMLWDEGTWEPVPDEDKLDEGKLKFVIHGARLKGRWMLVRIRNNRDRKSKAENWLLFKERDDYAQTETTPITERALTSVRTGRTMAEIAEGDLEWTRSGARRRAGADASDKRAPRKDASGERLPLPKFAAPQMATLVEDAPEGEEWVHEIKYDGYRAITAVAGGLVRIYTRNGLDWTDKFSALVQPIADLPCKSALLDGEVAVLDAKGRSDFGALQNAIAEGRSSRMVYELFDLIELDGESLRNLPLVERKAKLAELLRDSPKAGPLLYSDHVVGNGAAFFEHAAKLSLEGIISKRADARYRSERTRTWLKAKTGLGDEFIVVGFEASTVKSKEFGALLLASREDGKLVYRGKVGSGFGRRELDLLWPELEPRIVKKPPVEVPPEFVRQQKVTYVKPEVVVEVAFRGISSDNLLRQASFKGLRQDKSAAEVDTAPDMPAPTPPPAKDADPPKKVTTILTIERDRDGNAIEIEGVKVTNPGRVLFPQRKITKKQLIQYYLDVADRILPHIANRPLSLVRCPRGEGADCFFQKHATKGFPEEFRPIEITERDGTDTYLYIEDKRGLVAAVQMGALELHIWGSHVDTLEQPDRLVFDFDPDEDIGFDAVKAGAREMRDRLKSIGLTSFPMVTGGKGIHVVVPLTPKHYWEDIRLFAEALARTMAAEEPTKYLAEMSKAKRKGRIFIDYLRNGRGATAIGPFSTRAKPGATLSWPISWKALDTLENAHPVTVETYKDALKAMRPDPWKGYFDVDQVLPMEKLRGG